MAVETGYSTGKGLHPVTFGGQKTWTGYTVPAQISEAAMRLRNWQSSEGHQGKGFGIGLGALGTVVGLETESNPM